MDQHTRMDPHSRAQDDSPLTPEVEREEERRMLAFFRDRHLFQDLVDDLEPTPPVFMLKVWGVAHGVYPARAIPQWPPLPLSEEDLSAWRSRWEEKRRERRQHGQP